MKIIKTIPLCGHVDFLHRVLFVTQLPPQTFAFPKAAAESSAIVTDTPPTWFPWAAGVCFFKYFVSSFWDSISKEKSNHIMRLEWNFWVWGMILQIWKRERTSHVPFCSPPTSLRHMVWLLAGDFAQGDDQEFSQPQLWETSVFSRRKGGLEPSSLPWAACWVHQRAQLTFAVLTGKTWPFLTYITSFRGPVDISK